MKSINKTLFRFCFISLSISLILCLTSCFNIFSRGNDDEEQTATFTGYINIDSILGSDFIITDSAQRSARPAPISISETDSTSEYKYNISVTKTKDEDGNELTPPQPLSETPDIDYTNHCFELSDLTFGEWNIVVSIIKKSDNTEILSDSCTPTLSSDNPSFKYDFFLKPVTEGSGSIALPMTFPTGIDSIKIEEIDSPDSELNQTYSSLSTDTSKTYTKNNVPCGVHKLRFTFIKGDKTLFETSQAINVLNSLITDKWVGGTSTLIKNDGTFELTNTLIEAWRQRRTDYFVGGSTDSNAKIPSDENYGSALDPLEHIKYAVSLINDIDYGGTEVKIHVAKGVTENLSSPRIEINSGKKVLIDVWNTEGSTAAPKIVRQSTLGNSMIKIVEGAELTIDGIIIDGGSANSSGNCGVHNEGTFTLKSGEIRKNYNTSTTNHGAGIYNAGTLNLFGGTISNNQMIVDGGLGGGVYSQGTINLKGAVTIKENGSSNLYLASGKKINITGALEVGANKSDIYITTADTPTAAEPYTFTTNYGYYEGHNAGHLPSTYFTGDNAVVTYQKAAAATAPATGDGEAILAVSGGTIKDALHNLDMSFSLSKTKFPEGADTSDAQRTIKITPQYIITELNGDKTILEGTAYTTALNETIWKINMYVGDQPITDCEWTTPDILIPAELTYHDTYTLVVRATYKGITFNQEFVINDSSPYVQIAPYSWTGTAEEVAALTPESYVYIADRTLNIPKLIACDHEVTQEEYEKYMYYYYDPPSDFHGKGPDLPVYSVHWYEAIMYCNLRSDAEGLTPAYSLVYFEDGQRHETKNIEEWMTIAIDPDPWFGGPLIKKENGRYCFNESGSIGGYEWFDLGDSNDKTGTSDTDGWIEFDQTANGWRLPTEVEWEYLARGGNTEDYMYAGSNTLNNVAWYNGNSLDEDGNRKVHKVKTKQPNSLGLYDMSGNVEEWCWDSYNQYDLSADTPYTGDNYYCMKVTRGGSYYASESSNTRYNNLSISSRDYGCNRDSNIGFRVVRTVFD